VRFQVLTAAVTIIVFWDVVPYGLVETDRRVTGAYRPGNGDSKYLWNLAKFYTKLHDAISQKIVVFK
jgi:hypothetical protein